MIHLTGDPRGGEASGHWETYYEIAAFFQAIAVDPQNPQPQTRDITCEEFVAEIRRIENNSTNAREFADELARTFLGASSSSMDDLRATENTRPVRLTVSDAGIKEKYQDFHTSGNGTFFDTHGQAQHLIAGMIVGRDYGVQPGLSIANSREGFFGLFANDPEDVRLNSLSVVLGWDLLRNPSRIVTPEPRIIHIPGYTAIAEAVRKQFCR